MTKEKQHKIRGITIDELYKNVRKQVKEDNKTRIKEKKYATPKYPKWIKTLKRRNKKMNTPYKIGKNYFIRTVTMIYTGELVKEYDKELVLKNCAWIADTGRYTQALETGDFDEVEIYPKDSAVIIGKGAIIDMLEVKWTLPNKQK